MDQTDPFTETLSNPYLVFLCHFRLPADLADHTYHDCSFTTVLQSNQYYKNWIMRNSMTKTTGPYDPVPVLPCVNVCVVN